MTSSILPSHTLSISSNVLIDKYAGGNTLNDSNPEKYSSGTLFVEKDEEIFEHQETAGEKRKSQHTIALSHGYDPELEWIQVGLWNYQKRTREIMQELERGYNNQSPARPKIYWKTSESFTTVVGIDEPSSFTEDDVIRKLKITVQTRRGLYGSVLDDFMADSMIHYAKLKMQYPDYSTAQMVNAIISKMNNEFRDSKTKERRQVDMEYMEAEDFPETYTVEEQIEIDAWIQSQSHTWKKAIKDFTEWNESAPEGEPVPKKLRQRLNRMSKPEVENHTRTFNVPKSNAVRGLRGHEEGYVYPEEFPVTVTKKEPRLKVNHPLQVSI